MDKYLVTGCSGFVASYFMEYLLKHREKILIRGIASRENFSFPNDTFQYIQVDMLNKKQLKLVLDEFQPNFIVHLAANSSVGQSWSEPLDTFQKNTSFFLNLVESVRELDLPCRILSVGSSEIYKAESLLPITEKDALEPKNPYAIARLAQEMIAKLYTQNYGLDIVMTRSFNHTGPRQPNRFVIASFVSQLVRISQNKDDNTMLVGNLNIERDFLDVRDVVSAYAKLLQYGKRGEIYNICSGVGRKLQDVIDIILDNLGINVNIKIDSTRLRPNEIISIIGDNTKLCTAIDWKPRYSFEQTIHDMITYYRN